MVPELKAVHWEPGDGPTECVALLTQSFRAQDWHGLFQIPSYVEWFHACDMQPAYDYHRLSLQLLQSARAGPVDAEGTGPPARARRAVRDLSRRARRRAAPRPDEDRAVEREPLGDVAARLAVDRRLRRLLRPALGRRARHDGRPARRLPRPERRRRLRRRPLPRPRRRPGRRPSTGSTRTSARRSSHEAEARMHAHLASHPQGKHGAHAYTLADFGLDEPAVRDRFAAYCERFDVEEGAMSDLAARVRGLRRDRGVAPARDQQRRHPHRGGRRRSTPTRCGPQAHRRPDRRARSFGSLADAVARRRVRRGRRHGPAPPPRAGRDSRRSPPGCTCCSRSRWRRRSTRATGSSPRRPRRARRSWSPRTRSTGPRSCSRSSWSRTARSARSSPRRACSFVPPLDEFYGGEKPWRFDARRGRRWRRDRHRLALAPAAAHVAGRDPRGRRRARPPVPRAWRASRCAGRCAGSTAGRRGRSTRCSRPGPLGPEPLFRITGTKGELVIEGIGRVKLYDGTEPRGTVVGQGNYLQSYEGELADFAAVVLDGVAAGGGPGALARRAAGRARDVPLGRDEPLGTGLGGRHEWELDVRLLGRRGARHRRDERDRARDRDARTSTRARP